MDENLRKLGNVAAFCCAIFGAFAFILERPPILILVLMGGAIGFGFLAIGTWLDAVGSHISQTIREAAIKNQQDTQPE